MIDRFPENISIKSLQNGDYPISEQIKLLKNFVAHLRHDLGKDMLKGLIAKSQKGISWLIQRYIIVKMINAVNTDDGAPITLLTTFAVLLCSNFVCGSSA